MQKLKRVTFSYFILFIVMITVGCQNQSSKDAASERREFSNYSEELFIKEVQSDSITLNYTLAHPENFGITDYIPTFGEYTLDSKENNLMECENQLAKLKTFHYPSLLEEQKLTYDILEYTLKANLSIQPELFLYSEALSPTLGIQSQLPVLLAEYNFYNKSDIDHYITLLKSIDGYYETIANFEREKSKAGLFMNKKEAETVIEQCNMFIAEPEKNLLITIFNEKIENYPNLTKSEKAAYKKANKKNVLNHVIPAYETLINCLDQLKDTGVNDEGLCHFPKGKEYYELLVKSNTGSSKSINQMLKLLNDTIYDNIAGIQKITEADPDSVKEMLNIKYGLTNPDDILSYLKEAIQKDYPSIDEVSHTVKYVDKSLEEYLSPAFYLTPALDNYEDNSIYINKSPQYDLSSIFTTLAHEGYPGHLYQSVFYNQQNPEPIRSIFNFGGYTEGWATYVEIESFAFAGFSKNVSALLQMNKAATLALYARVDIGIHYEGWSYDKTASYLKQILGITNEDTIESFYRAIIEDPSNYLKYTIGYLEFKELREKAEEKLGKSFQLKNFHEFVLKNGPAPFDILEKNMTTWIKKQ